MKKAILLLAAALLFCGEMKAQDLADAFTLNPTLNTTPQLSLTDNSQASLNSIYAIPMPESDLLVNNQFNTQQYSSRTGWGIFCIVTGASTMLGGLSVWLFGDLFNNLNEQGNNMSSGFDDPEFQQFQQQGDEMAQTVGNTVKTIGIVSTVVGAGILGTGIWLVSSDGNSSSSHGRRSHSRRGGHRRGHRRHADFFQQPSIEPDWGLCLNVAPTNAGLTFVF